MIGVFERGIDYMESNDDAEMFSELLTDTTEMAELRQDLHKAGVKGIAGI